MKKSPDKNKKKNNKFFYFLVSFCVVILALIVNKDIGVPSWLTIGVSVLISFFLLFSGIKNPEVPFYVLVAYVPFNKVFSGTFGGFMTALNLTNILILITLFCLMVSRGMGPKVQMIEGGREKGEGGRVKDDGRWTMPACRQGRDDGRKNHKTIQRVRSGFHWLVVLFCLFGIFSVFRGGFYYGSKYVMEFVVPLKRWLTPIFLYFIAYGIIRNKEILKKTIIIIMIVVAVAGLLTVKEGFDLGDAGSLDSSRVGGIAQSPNMMAAFFVYYMFLYFGFFLTNWRNISRWALLVPFLICFRGIQVTYSRGALLAFAFALIGLTFIKNKLLFFIICAGIIFAVLNPQILPGGFRYAISRTDKGGEVFEGASLESRVDPSSAKRLEIWQGAVEIIKDNPVFGVGYGVFPYIIPYYTSGIGEMDAHNTYLIIAAEMGIPVLLVFLLIILVLFKNTWWLYRRVEDKFIKAVALGMLGGIAGMLVANMFGSRLESEEVSAYFWILAGLIIRAVMMKKRKEIV
jgi:O-antigen ligase